MTTDFDAWDARKAAEADDAYARVLAITAQRNAEREAARRLQAQREAERRAEAAQAAARLDAEQASLRAEERTAFIRQHPESTEVQFERYWNRIRPTADEWRERKIQQEMEAMRGRAWSMPPTPPAKQMQVMRELGPGEER
jgi:hypothetical protein